MEQLWTQNQGTTFTGHRGEMFLKVIQINTNRQLTLSARMSPNADCQLTIRDRHAHAPNPLTRAIKFIWFNAASPNPAMLQTSFLWMQYLANVVATETPDVVVITGTGSGCSKPQIAQFIRMIGHREQYLTDVGIDGGSFCVSCRGNGRVRLSEGSGYCIQQGIDFDYDWY